MPPAGIPKTFVRLRNSYFGRVLSSLDLVTAPSEYIRRLAEQADWVPNGTVEVAPIGFLPFETVDRQHRQAGAPIRLGALGNFKPFGRLDLKGARVLLQALKGLPPNGAELHLHGIVEGPWRESFESTPGVVLHGPYTSEQRAEIYASLDAVVIPSLVESYSLVAREALLAGIPIIAARTGGLPEIVQDGINGLLFDPADSLSLRQVLHRLVEDPGLIEKLRQGIQPPLGIAEDAKEWERRYAKLAGDKTVPVTDRKMSVVIPTCNRREWLTRCLEGFIRQTLPRDNFEVIVVDDHSDDPLEDLVNHFADKLPLRYLRQPERRGPSAARNAGWRAATGDIVLLFDDDDRPTPRLLAEHMRGHLDRPESNVAILGYRGWDPALNITPVMYHVTQAGKQYFCYLDIPVDTPLPWHYFWTGCTSVKQQFLAKSEGFDEDFPLPAMDDDIDLAYRLRERDITVFYNSRAVSYGMRPLDTADFCRRWKNLGKGMAVFMRKHADPHLIDRFNILNAEGTWQSLQSQLPQIEQNIANLADKPLALLRSIPVRDGQGRIFSAEDLLHVLYRTFFEAQCIGAYVQATARGAESTPYTTY